MKSEGEKREMYCRRCVLLSLSLMRLSKLRRLVKDRFVLSAGRLPLGYKNKRKRESEREGRKRERGLSLFVVYLERETDDSFCSHVEPFCRPP